MTFIITISACFFFERFTAERSQYMDYYSLGSSVR